MKFENNWRQKSLEALEKDYWDEPEYPSPLVSTCHRLRKKPLQDFSTEDLRIMIGQNIGLEHLIPLALEVLGDNILAEGDFYEGDLLRNVLRSDAAYWQREKGNWQEMCRLFREKSEELKAIDTLKEIRDGWFGSFEAFEKIQG